VNFVLPKEDIFQMIEASDYLSAYALRTNDARLIDRAMVLADIKNRMLLSAYEYDADELEDEQEKEEKEAGE
jgi:hypothetical protein